VIEEYGCRVEAIVVRLGDFVGEVTRVDEGVSYHKNSASKMIIIYDRPDSPFDPDTRTLRQVIDNDFDRY
jgi:hypothetical protein